MQHTAPHLTWSLRFLTAILFRTPTHVNAKALLREVQAAEEA